MNTHWTLLNKLLVVSYGAGVDSTAMLVGFVKFGIRPDLIVFSDTGGEKPTTYLYLWNINKWLVSVGFPTVTIVRRVPPRAKYRTLEENCTMNETLPSLAFNFSHHSCSIEWKAKPIDRYVKAWAKGAEVVRAIGYDAGGADAKRVKKAVRLDAKRAAEVAEKDAKRAARCKGTFKPTPGTECWYPLVEWGWDRERCIAEIEGAGLRVPSKSSCFFCPAMKLHEIEELAATEPELFKRALAMEAGARDGKHGLKKIKGLGGADFAWSELGLVPGAPLMKEAA